MKLEGFEIGTRNLSFCCPTPKFKRLMNGLGVWSFDLVSMVRHHKA